MLRVTQGQGREGVGWAIKFNLNHVKTAAPGRKERYRYTEDGVRDTRGDW